MCVPPAAAVRIHALLRVICDDGAVVYLNGNEVARIGMPRGDITFSTLASRAIEGTAELVSNDIVIPAVLVNNGKNVIAVEVRVVSSAR
jgi:hypothetical protein